MVDWSLAGGEAGRTVEREGGDHWWGWGGGGVSKLLRDVCRTGGK